MYSTKPEGRNPPYEHSSTNFLKHFELAHWQASINEDRVDLHIQYL